MFCFVFGVFSQDILQNETLYRFTSDFKIGLASDVAKVGPSVLEIVCILVPRSGSTFKKQRTLSLFQYTNSENILQVKILLERVDVVCLGFFSLLSFCALPQISALLGYGIPTPQPPGVPWPPY